MVKPLRSVVAQIHAFEHARPVLRLGAAGAGLNFDEARVGVHRVRKHAAEFEIGDTRLDLARIVFDRFERGVVLFVLGHLEQFKQIVGLRVDFLQRDHHAVEQLLLLAEFLSARLIVPDRGVFQRYVHFFELRCLVIVVKDTSAVPARDA